MAIPDKHLFFATTTRGLEGVLAEELKQLGATFIEQRAGGVSFRGNLRLGYTCTLWLRSAARVLLNLSEFPAKTADEIYAGVKAVPWESWLSPDKTLAVQATSHYSEQNHTHFIALKTKDAVVDRLRQVYSRRPDVDRKSPQVVVNIRLHEDVGTISLDLGGRSLHKRGYRASGGAAPLKENLAAGLLLLAGYDGSVALVDGMCGSGTLAIEAAMIARNIAPGLLKQDFSFQHWHHYDEKGWLAIQKRAGSAKRDAAPAPIYANDLNDAAIANARKNAAAAGVRRDIRFSSRDIEDFRRIQAEKGIIICNPPYGERLGELETLDALYKKIGNTYKRQFAGFEGFLFTGNLDIIDAFGLKPSRRIPLFNGPIESRLLKYELYEGSAEKPAKS